VEDYTVNILPAKAIAQEITSDGNFSLSLIPNPASDRVTVSWSGDIFPEDIRVFDLTGKLIHYQVVTDESEVILNVSEWNDGIYLVQAVNVKGEKSMCRLVKTN
jgi:hypothetical protein